MIETVPFDTIFSFFIGLTVAWAARVQLASEIRVEHGRHLVMVLMFQVLAFCPLGAYLYVTNPAWSWNYLFDPKTLPPWAGFVVIGAYVVVAVAGYVLGAWFIRNDRAALLPSVVASTLIVLGGYTALMAERLWWVGSYSEWVAGPQVSGMREITRDRLGWVLGGAGPLVLGVFVFLVARVYFHGRRLRAAI